MMSLPCSIRDCGRQNGVLFATIVEAKTWSGMQCYVGWLQGETEGAGLIKAEFSCQIFQY